MLVVMLVGCSGIEPAVEPRGPRTTALLVRRDLAVGHRIDKDDLVVATEFPTKLVPEGASVDLDEILGRRLLQPLLKHDHLDPSRLGRFEGSERGYEVVRIPVSSAPHPVPGQRVDLVRRGSEPCVYVEAAPVAIGLVGDDDLRWVHEPGVTYVALAIVVPIDAVDSASVDELALWVRAPADHEPLGDALPPCR